MKKNKKIYIHYGSNSFSGYITPEDMFMNKPKGLWASPVKSEYGWRDFCRDNNFREESLKYWYTFRIRKYTKILRIRSHKDIIKYLKINPHSTNKDIKPLEELIPKDFYIFNDKDYIIDFEKIYRRFDGIEIDFINNYEEFHYSYLFNSYDVDSLIIWNTNKIILKVKKFN